MHSNYTVPYNFSNTHLNYASAHNWGMKLVDNLNKLMKERGLNPHSLSLKSGVPQPTIRRILEGESKEPRRDTLGKLAKFFKVTVEQLYGVTPLNQQKLNNVLQSHSSGIHAIDDESEIDGDYDAMIEEVEIPLSAGPGYLPDFAETGNFRIVFQKRWLKKWGAKPEEVKLFRVDGYSMEPVLFDGDRVAVHVSNKQLKSGHVYAFLLNGETKIKRLFNMPDGGIRIVCDNPDKTVFPDEHIKPDAVEDVFVMIGRVIDKSGSGGL